MVTKTKMLGFMLAATMMSISPMMVYADGGSPTDAMASSHQDGGWHHGPQDHMFAKVLNLSDDQVKQMKDSWEKDKTAMKGVFEQMKSNREAFEAEIVKATPDMNKITDLQNQLKTIQGQMADSRLNSMLEIKKILTPEQFAGFMALQKEKKLMMHGHHKFGHKDGMDKKGAACKVGSNKTEPDHDSDSQD